MLYDTDWVKNSNLSSGRDHSGTQAPCINLYSQLLPGINNVTDRARYYTFYPWFFWAYEKECDSLRVKDIVNAFRRADCLFTLISARHTEKNDNDTYNHNIALVGNSTLIGLLYNTDGELVEFSDYALRDSYNRYFKNKFGGLGQYYIGVLRELGILTGDGRTGIKYGNIGFAPEIAEAFDSGVDRKLFFKAVKSGVVSKTDLDRLKTFCPCYLKHNKAELDVLNDIFFDRRKIYGVEGQRRYNTLFLILNLIKTKNNSKDLSNEFNHNVFREAVYTEYLSKKTKWELPDNLLKIRKLWATYQRNEMLSVAVQAIFWVALNVLSEVSLRFNSSEAFTEWFIESDLVVDAFKNECSTPFHVVLEHKTDNMPNIHDVDSMDHEINICRTLFEKCKNNNLNNVLYSEIIKSAYDLITILVARTKANCPAYDNEFEFPDNYFSYYGVTLYSLHIVAKNDWSKLNCVQVLAFIVNKWGIENHFKVALRKLRNNSLDTFKVRPTDTGIRVVDVTNIPGPLYTTPRLKQAVQILKDMGLLKSIDYKNDKLIVTKEGLALLKGKSDDR